MGFQLDPQRFLRILGNGKTDLNGGRNGPWTEFRVTPQENGVQLQGVKSMLWLTIAAGEFVSSSEPVMLVPAFHNKGSAPAEPSEEGQLWLRLESGEPFPVRIQKKGPHVLLATNKGGNFACAQIGKFHCQGGEGQWARWTLEATPQGVTIKNVGHNKYLARDAAGVVKFADEPTHFACNGTLLVQEVPPIDKCALSADDIAHFRENGYIILKGAVAPDLVRDGLRAINHQLGKPDCWVVDSNPLNAAQLMLKLPPEGIGGDIVNKSPRFWSALNILLGEGNVAPWSRGQQVALRFPLNPSLGHNQPDVTKRIQYHIDGMGQNNLCPFSLLCGVALSDQMRPNCGNLHVFPRSHLNEELHKYYSELINDDGQGEADENKPDVGESVQVLLEPGDVVIAHQLLAHRVGKNTCEHIRYQLYYRVSHKRHEEFREKIVQNPWIEFAI